MQGRAFLLKFGFDDLLGVIPRGSSIGHEDCLVETEDRNRNQIANKKERFHKGKGQGPEEDGEEDVEHSLLRVLGADLNHFLAVSNGGLLRALQFDVGLDELDRAIGARGNGLRGCACEPVDHCATGYQSQKEWSVQQRKFFDIHR